jgi:hypothetical protein
MKQITAAQRHKEDNMELTGRIEMPLQEWIDMEDHPKQRDTETHARKAARHHLKGYDPVHRCVVAVEFNGRRYKVDGHTRAYLWATNNRLKPSCVLVDVWRARLYDDFMAIYDKFDNHYAVETPSETLAAVCKKCGLEMLSSYLRQYKWGTALQMIFQFGAARQHRYKAYTDAIANVREEMRAIDDIGLTGNRVPNIGVVVAAIILFRLYNRDRVHAFFEDWRDTQVIQSGKCRNAIGALEHLIERKRIEGSIAGTQNCQAVAEHFIAAYHRFANGDKLTLRHLTPTPLDKMRNKFNA